MTDAGQTPSDDLDNLIDDILPDDLDEATVAEAAAESHSGASDAWFRSNYTNSLQVDADRRDEIAADLIQQLTSELQVAETTAPMAENIFSQFVERRDKPYLVELQATAALYCACKLNGDAIGPSEISDAGPELITRKRLLRRSKSIASTLGLDATAFMDATQYVNRYCDELGVPSQIRDRANEIVELCDEAGVSSGKSPTGWAAAAVYLSAREHGEKVTQQDLASVANTTEVTIRNRYQDQQSFVYGTDDMPETCADCIEWLSSRADLSNDIQIAAEEICGCLDGISHEITGHDPSGLTDALQTEPEKWAGAILLLASEALDQPLGTKQFSVILDVNGGEFTNRVRILKQVLRAKHVDPLSEPQGWDIHDTE